MMDFVAKSCRGLVSSAVVAALLADLALAQMGNGSNQYPFTQFNPPMTSILVALVAALFFMGLCSIYLRHCNEAPVSVGSIRRGLSMRARRAAPARGLDQEIIDNIPTFSYSEVKEHKIGKGALECAVCLNEFVEDDTLRLLPHCDHVFHPDCVDAWLAHHTTCPVCRADLTQPPAAPPPPLQVPENNPVVSRPVEIAIQIDERQGRTAAGNLSPNFENPNPLILPNFRSHSTGHSLILQGENLDRFTLRLPDGMKKEVIERCMLNRTRSYAVREGGTVPGFRIDESSSNREARSSQKLRATKSERWVLFRRALSMKSPKVGTNYAGGRATARMASFKCLEPRAADEHESDPNPNEGAIRGSLLV